jgi:stage II sporulation protein D
LRKNPVYTNKTAGIMILILSCCLIFINFSCKPSSRYLIRKKLRGAVDSNYIRVLVSKSSSRITIASKSKFRISSKKSRRILYESKNKRVTIYSEKLKNTVIVESWNSPLYLNQKPYRGTIEIHNILGKLHIINILKLNEYLYSVVPSEIPSKWEREALKAQAVAARTYAYYHLIHNKQKRLYDLDATTNFQVYKGMEVEQPSTTDAVNSTIGEIITYKHEPILAYFHSTCGGRTIDDKHIWKGSDFPYLTGVRCPYCNASPHFKWEVNLSLFEIRDSITKRKKSLGSIRGIAFKKNSGRVTDVEIRHSNGKLNMTGNNFRLTVHPKKIKSMYFKTKKLPNGLRFNGRGWGHGVGMCQWGAKGLAMRGKNYKRIISYYYRGVRIVRLRNSRYALNKKTHQR